MTSIDHCYLSNIKYQLHWILLIIRSKVLKGMVGGGGIFVPVVHSKTAIGWEWELMFDEIYFWQTLF